MKTTLQDKVHHALDDMRELRDEIRLNIHLARMDAKDAVQKKVRELFRRRSAAR